MIVFAEGTTTNGEGLIDFKKGAFVAGGPIKLLSLKYDGYMSYSYLGLSYLEMNMSLCTNFFGTCTIYEGDVPVISKEGVSWQEFAKETRRLMAEQMDFKLYKGDLR